MAMALVRLTADRSSERADALRELATEVDFDALLDMLSAQSLVSTLGGMLLRDETIDLPERTAQRIRATRLRARQRGLLDHGVTKRLTADLHTRGIPVVPLKGATLAETAYGDIGARQASDIDLLVPLSGLDQAVEVAEQHGWRERELSRDPGLPWLHRELLHDSLPPLEIHWRVHWYEETFADAAMARAQKTDDGWLRPQPADELAFLLLFLARDGFAGLRQVLDVAAWWGALGRDAQPARDVRTIADAHPELEPALTAAARYAEAVAGIPERSLIANGKLSGRQRAAMRLQNPWLTGSRAQVEADISLVDALLAPPRGLRPFVSRQLLIPRSGLVRRQPHLEHASRTRVGAARLGHAGRVLTRYGLASPRAVRRRRRPGPGLS
jgi:hypothetical protein